MPPQVKLRTPIVSFLFITSVAHAQYGVGAMSNADIAKALKKMNDCISTSCGGGPEKGIAILDAYRKRKSEIPTSEQQREMYPPEVLSLRRQLEAKEKELDTFTTEALGRVDPTSQERLHGSAQRMYSFLSGAKFLELVEYDRNGLGENFRVNVEKTHKKMSGVPAADRDWYIEIAANRLRIEREFVVAPGELEARSPVLLLKSLYPGASAERAIEILRERTRNEILQVKSLSPFEQSLYFATLSRTSLETLISTEARSLTENDLRDLIRWNVRTTESKALFGAENTALLKRETPTIAELLKAAGGRDELSRTYAKMNDKNTKSRNEKFGGCEATYFMNTGLLPNGVEQARLKADVARTKLKVKAAVEANFPDSVKGALLEAIDRSDFVLPPTVEEFKKSFSENIRRDFNSSDESLAALKKAKESEIQGILVAMLSSASFKSYINAPPKENATPEPNSLCDGFKYEPASDGNYTALGTIVLSYTTPKLPEESRIFFIAHELGHSIGQTLLDDPALRVLSAPFRKCLAAAHKEPMTSASMLVWQREKAYGARLDGLYVDEDVSDVIGFEANKEQKGPNPWCPLMKRAADKKSFADLSLISKPEDPHSANLYRLLALDYMRDGSIRRECKEAFGGFGIFPEFERCILLLKPGGQKALAPSPAAGAPTSK